MTGKRTALIVIDVQKAYQNFRLPNQTSPLFGDSVERALFVIYPTLALFRERKMPVFFVQHTDLYVAEGSEGFQLVNGLSCLETDYHLTKRHPNSFFKTELAAKLRKENVGFVVLCGLAAGGGCVDATVQGAMENDFGVAILRHGVAGIKDEYIRVAQEVYPTISLEALRFFLNCVNDKAGA